jgi:hypothetical protein
MLNFVAATEHLMPFGSQSEFQPGKRWQAWKIFSGFNALDVAWTDANFFCQFLLRQMSAFSERGDIFTEPSSVSVFFWLAHRHRQMLAKMSLPKHEALPRD